MFFDIFFVLTWLRLSSPGKRHQHRQFEYPCRARDYFLSEEGYIKTVGIRTHDNVTKARYPLFVREYFVLIT